MAIIFDPVLGKLRRGDSGSSIVTIEGGLVPRGEYDNSTNYAVGDSVSYEDSSYVMYVDAPAGTLPTDTSYWQLLAGSGNASSFNVDIVDSDLTQLEGEESDSWIVDIVHNLNNSYPTVSLYNNQNLYTVPVPGQPVPIIQPQDANTVRLIFSDNLGSHPIPDVWHLVITG